MRQKKLIRLLDALAANEGRGIAAFKRHLKLPATQSARMVSLLDYLDKAKSDEELNEETIFRKVISCNQNYDEKKVRNLFSALTGLLEDFIEIESMRKKSTLRKRLLAEFLQNRQLDGQFLKAARESITKDLPQNELERYTELWLGNRLLYFHPKANLHEEVEFDQTLEDWHYNSNALHAVESLKYCCEAVVLNKTYGKELAADFYDYFPSYIRIIRPKERQVPLVLAYIKAATFYLSPTLANYLAFKDHLLPRLDSFQAERGALLIYLINALNIAESTVDRSSEYFELVQLGVSKSLFIDKGVISSNYFNNIVYIACELEEYAWAEQFIQNYFPCLKNKKASLANIKLLADCYLDFGKKKYADILTNLKKIKNEYYSYALRKYVLEIKCHYEIYGVDAYVEIADQCRYFREYLQRKIKRSPISQSLYQRNYNFTVLIKKITAHPSKRMSSEALMQQLNDFKGKIIEQRWLTDKINRLK